jgi:hypothetical protein
MTKEYETVDRYDRIYAAMHDIALITKPTTIQLIQPLTGKAETFVIQTARHEDGDYIFVQRLDENGTVRLALPPKVANAIAAQRDALTKRRRSISSRNTMRNRMESGEWTGFQKKA